MTIDTKQRGVALIMTLVVVMIATLLATEIWFRNSIDISRQYNNRSLLQANHYAKGMVLWAFDVLREDYERNPGFDNLTEIWNKPISGLYLEDATLSGKLENLDGKFNLNNLYINGVTPKIQLEFFKRLLLNLELSEDLAYKIIDWMDPDIIRSSNGAEDDVYLSRSPAYRSSGQKLVHISELKLIDGIDTSTYERLKPFVTVLPNVQISKININTAPAVILKSLDDQIKQSEAVALFNQGRSAFHRIDDFFQHSAISGYALNNQQSNVPDEMRLTHLIDVKSQWFQASVTITMDQSSFNKYAIVQRSSLSSTIKSWSQTSYN